jgi:Zn-dependent protease with chaperone function
MSAPYAVRLFCLCLASFFLVSSIAGLIASFASRAAVRMAETMRARSAARFLFSLRLLPLASGVGAVLGLCIPSYLWLEPRGTPERVGFICLTLALLAVTGCFLSLIRTARAIAVSLRCNRSWQRAGRETLLTGGASPALVVEKEAPLLALSGILRPRLVVSDGVLRSLSSEELDVALHHENAHRASRDNLKRLLLLLAPGPIPFVRGFALLEQAWARFSEWAADDEATQGDSHRALSLAAALLRVARMGAGPRLSFLHTSLVADDRDLSTRIDRLLRLDHARPVSLPRTKALLSAAGVGISLCLATILILWPATLASVHRLLEQFLR